MSDFWKNYDSKSTFDGYISKEKKLRSHAKIIAGILEKYGKKKFHLPRSHAMLQSSLNFL